MHKVRMQGYWNALRVNKQARVCAIGVELPHYMFFSANHRLLYDLLSSFIVTKQLYVIHLVKITILM